MKTDKKIFTQRLDIYGQALAIYVFVLIIFSVFYGTLESGEFRFVFSPLLIMMFGIILIGAFMLLLAAIKRKHIIIENNIIAIVSRFHSVKFSIEDISKIHINKSTKNNIFVRIKLKRKKKNMLIRTASYNDSKELIKAFNGVIKEHLLIKDNKK